MGGRFANGRWRTSRRAIGFVPQDTYLFSETLRENIAFGVETATPGRFQMRRVVASIDAEIAEFPARYRNDGRRARHHAFRRAKTAHGAGRALIRKSENTDSG